MLTLHTEREPKPSPTHNNKMKANEDLLTKEQIKEAKAAIKSLLKLRNKIDFLEEIEDMDGHTDGLAYDAAQADLELGDKIYGLQSIIERIENYGK